MARAMLLAAASALALAACAHVTPAQALTHRMLPLTCPKGTLIADGCLQANPNSNFQLSTSLYVHAATSGQTWASSSPWNWNGAGLDPAEGYPVGWDTTLTYTDVTVASAGSGPGQIPPGCVYSATAGPGGTPRLECTNSAPITLRQLDFAASNVLLRLCGSGATTVINDKFKNGANTNIVNGQLLNVCAGDTFPLTIAYNEFDGNNRNGFNAIYQAISAAANTATIQYSYFHDFPQQLIVAAPLNTSIQVSNNYVEGWNLNPSGGLHGAVLESITTSSSAAIASQIETFNTVVEPTGVVGIQGTTSFSFLGNAASNFQTITSAEVGHNIVVFNCGVTATNCTVPDATVNAALTDIFGLQSVGTLTIDNNFVDPHGAETCVQTLGMATGIVGKIDNGSGSPGNTLTVTSTAVTRPYIYAYQFLTGTGIPSSSQSAGYYVQPYGTNCDGNASTGIGQAGTYCVASVSGGPLNVASAANWETASTAINAVPGLPINPTMINNIDLLDGSTITQAGVSMNAGACFGHI